MTFAQALPTKFVYFNPNKAGLFEGRFFWGGQYNLIQLLNNLFKVGWK